MQVKVSFRNIEPSDPLRLYAEDKLSRIKKYLEEPIEAHLVLKVEKFRHIAEISIDAPSLRFNGNEQTSDMYGTIDLLVDSLEGQIKKEKEKGRRRRAAGSKESAAAGESTAEAAPGANEEPRVIRSEQVYAKPMHLDEAVMELNIASCEFMVFTNRSTNRVNVLYRRKDGNFGLIETIG